MRSRGSGRRRRRSTSITMLPESWYALSETVPLRGLAAFGAQLGRSRCRGPSLLRTRCVSGSPIFSTTVLSSSVSSPWTTRAMSLPISRETSCTTRWKRLKVAPILTMRSCSALSRTCSTRPDQRRVAFLQLDVARAARQPGSRRADAMISSPTRLIRRSSLSASTRMDWRLGGLRRPWPRFCFVERGGHDRRGDGALLDEDRADAAEPRAGAAPARRGGAPVRAR